MPPVTPPALTTIPPFPQLADRAAGTYNSKGYAFGQHMSVTFNVDQTALAANVFANATDAATNAGTASTAAAIASSAATSASISASTASTQAASVLTMDKRYLGSKASAPTLDNQGAALAAGAVYYDTVLLKVRTWNGSAWVEGISAVAGVSSVNGATGAVVLASQTGRIFYSMGA